MIPSCDQALGGDPLPFLLLGRIDSRKQSFDVKVDCDDVDDNDDYPQDCDNIGDEDVTMF